MEENSRRSMLKKMAAGGLAFAAAPSLNAFAKSENEAYQLKGNINHSVCQWCVSFVTLEEMCQWINSMNVKAIDLIKPQDWSMLQKYGIECSMCYTDGKISLTEGWNHTENHSWLIEDFKRSIPLVGAAKYKNLICFSGNRNGMDDETGMNNCVKGLKEIMSLAEKNNVIIQMELFNSKIDHNDYMADKSAWGVELCKRIDSPNFKLLYDIYHMQINEGDVIRTIKDNHQYFGHYHTAGGPGRNDIDETQELYYPAIMKSIHETGFTGFVAQEFIAKGGDNATKLTALQKGIEICDV
ncbi:MAG: TIM barrel protein [Saprospiraceae bacterium]